jgi:hypothetical protein
MNKARSLSIGLGILQVLIGVGAVIGGFGLVLAPDGANLKLPLEALNKSPFRNYLIPGIVLLCINGICNLGGSILSFSRKRYAGGTAMVLGAFLIIWIVVQVWWIGLISFLQPLYFCIGLIESIWGLLLYKLLAER